MSLINNNSSLGNIRIIKMYLMETGTMNPMLGRSLNTQFDQNSIQILGERVSNTGNLSPTALAGVAGSIVVPGQVDRFINIDGGWNNKRYRFVIHAEPIDGSFAQNIICIYSGYTNGASEVALPNGGYDFPNEMAFYVNNCVTVNRVSEFTMANSNNNVGHFVQNASHFIHERTLGTNLQATFDANTLYPTTVPSMIRPMDVMRSIASRERSEVECLPEVDLRTAVATNLSSRSNNLPSTYLSSNLNAVAKARYDEMWSNSGGNLYENAAAIAADQTAFRDPLIAKLNVGGSQLPSSGMVSWGELKNIFPELSMPGTVKVMRKQDAQKIDIYQNNAGDYEPWYRTAPTGYMVNESFEALIANYIMNTVPSIMLECMIARVQISVTNMTLNGGLLTNINPPFAIIPTLTQGALIHLTGRLQHYIEHMVFQDLPINMQMPFSVSMHIDVFGESQIRVGINGQPEVPFCVPTYSDAMFTPMVTTYDSTLKNIANDIRFITSQLS